MEYYKLIVLFILISSLSGCDGGGIIKNNSCESWLECDDGQCYKGECIPTILEDCESAPYDITYEYYNCSEKVIDEYKELNIPKEFVIVEGINKEPYYYVDLEALRELSNGVKIICGKYKVKEYNFGYYGDIDMTEGDINSRIGSDCELDGAQGGIGGLPLRHYNFLCCIEGGLYCYDFGNYQDEIVYQCHSKTIKCEGRKDCGIYDK